MAEIPEILAREVCPGAWAPAAVVGCLASLGQAAIHLDHEHKTANATLDRARALREQAERGDRGLPITAGEAVLSELESAALEHEQEILALYARACCAYALASVGALRVAHAGGIPTVADIRDAVLADADFARLILALAAPLPPDPEPLTQLDFVNLTREKVLRLLGEGVDVAVEHTQREGSPISGLAEMTFTDYALEACVEEMHNLGEACHFGLARLAGKPRPGPRPDDPAAQTASSD